MNRDVCKVSIGGIPLSGCKPLQIGLRHPSEAGALSFWLTSWKGRILEARIQPGWLHRGAEKLFEVRDYRSLIMLGDRHDWLASSSGELVLALAVENAMGLAPPARATWLRTLFAELARIHSHLSYLSYLGDSVWPAVDGLREILAAASGNRVHPMLVRVGGLAADVTRDWLAHIDSVLVRAETAVHQVAENLATRRVQLDGVAVADATLCRQYALTGPVARACALPLDLRAEGLLAWPEIFVAAPLQSAGDATARFQVLIDEVAASAEMVRRLAAGLPGGPVATRLSRRLKVPEGEHVAELEAPWGVASVLLVSRGGQTPWRVALRTPTFHNVSALERLLVGLEMRQVPDAVASVGYAVGDLDK